VRVFSVALALWVDPLWLRNARRSWRVRRFWLALRPVGSPKSEVRSRRARVRAWVGAGRWTLHLLAFDVHVRLEGVKRGPERAKGQG